MSNYPAGADNDPRAPYNEELTEERNYYISVTLSFPTKMNVLPNTEDSEVKVKIKDEMYKDVNSISEDINIDELIITRE